MLERISVHYAILYGASIGFYSGHHQNLSNDLQWLKPTIFQAVPKILNSFYDNIMSQLDHSTSFSKLLLNYGLKSKVTLYDNSGFISNSLLDFTVFYKFKQALGGRVRFMLTGSAPIRPEVLKFLRIVFGCPIIEGYGLAESCAASFVTLPGDVETGHIGGPTPSVEVKLVDLPDIGYFNFDVNQKGEWSPRGELCLRGPTLLKEYYKDEHQTSLSLDEEGWLHTGDIAVRLPHNGAFRLIDRKQGVFKLSNGEFVTISKLELLYNQSKFVDQIFVYGESTRPYLVAVIVPNEDFIRKYWAPHNRINRDKALEEFCQNPKLKEDILSDLEKKGLDEQLAPYEIIRKILLEPNQWSSDDILTSSQKVNRKAAFNKYSYIIEGLYE